MRLPAVVGLVIAVIGCVPATSAPSSGASGSQPPSGSAAPATSVCQDIDLQLPNGDPLDLTGTWLGNDGSYWPFTQLNDCVWATATDQYGFPDGSSAFWQIYLRGTLLSDFTIPIEYAYSPFAGSDDGGASHYGHAVLTIEFGADGALTLRKTAGCSGGEDTEPCPPGEGNLQTTAWSLVSTRILLPPPTPKP